MDQLLGFVDWVLNLILWVGIPVSVTFTLIYQYFQTLKADDGRIHNPAGGKGNDAGTVGGYFKDVIKIFLIALIAWVAIYLIRDLLPAAGSAAVGGLGF